MHHKINNIRAVPTFVLVVADHHVVRYMVVISTQTPTREMVFDEMTVRSCLIKSRSGY